MWSLQTGRLLDVLAGHEAPLSELCFSPSQGVLASASWDGTVKLWDVFKSECIEVSFSLSLQGKGSVRRTQLLLGFFGHRSIDHASPRKSGGHLPGTFPPPTSCVFLVLCLSRHEPLA